MQNTLYLENQVLYRLPEDELDRQIINMMFCINELKLSQRVISRIDPLSEATIQYCFVTDLHKNLAYQPSKAFAGLDTQFSNMSEVWIDDCNHHALVKSCHHLIKLAYNSIESNRYSLDKVNRIAEKHNVDLQAIVS